MEMELRRRCALETCVAPVSYTHLDVYKRQCAACELVDRISEKHPVIIMADRGYENYNLFVHIEERLFDYVCLLYTSRCV